MFLPPRVSWIYPLLSITSPHLGPLLSVYINMTPVLVLLFSCLPCSLRFFSKIRVWWAHSTALNPSMAPHCTARRGGLWVGSIWACLPLEFILSQELHAPLSRLWPHLSALQWCHMLLGIWSLHRLFPTPGTLPSIPPHYFWSGWDLLLADVQQWSPFPWKTSNHPLPQPKVWVNVPFVLIAPFGNCLFTCSSISLEYKLHENSSCVCLICPHIPSNEHNASTKWACSNYILKN